MKRISLLIAATVLALPAAAPAAPSPAPSAENRELQEFCYALIASEEYPSLNLGECMSYNSVSEPGFKSHFCDLLRETHTLADWGFTTYSDCVKNPPF